MTLSPKEKNPKVATGRYNASTQRYAIITARWNIPGRFMSVCIVGKVAVPPKENDIAPNAVKRIKTFI